MAQKRLALMLDECYHVLELWYPYYRFKEADFHVDLVAAEGGKEYHSKEDYPCASDVAAGSASIDDYDCLVVPGGWAPDYMRRSPEVLKFANDMVDSGKIIAAICHGPWLLCSTKALNGKRATCFPAIVDDIKNAGAEYVDQPCVTDGKLITSRMPDDLPIFCATVVKVLNQ